MRLNGCLIVRQVALDASQHVAGEHGKTCVVRRQFAEPRTSCREVARLHGGEACVVGVGRPVDRLVALVAHELHDTHANHDSRYPEIDEDRPALPRLSELLLAEALVHFLKGVVIHVGIGSKR